MYQYSIQFGYSIHPYYFRIRKDYCTKFHETLRWLFRSRIMTIEIRTSSCNKHGNKARQQVILNLLMQVNSGRGWINGNLPGRTSPQPGSRMALSGNLHHRNSMVEVGTWSLPVKVHPEKKPQWKNSTVSDREFQSLSRTVEFFDLRIFSLGALLRAKIC